MSNSELQQKTAMPPADSPRILVADFDLCSRLEDEPAIYRRLFNVSTNMSFTYLRDRESAELSRPANVSTVKCRSTGDTFSPATAVSSFWEIAFAEAERIATAIGPLEFDVVEIPDYRADLLLLPWALKCHGARVGRVVVALHRRTSRSVLLGWDRSARAQRFGQQFFEWERLLFGSAAVRYGFSRNHLEEWQSEIDLENHYLCPLSLMAAPKAISVISGNDPPGICHIGGLDRHRGADRFLDFAWQVPSPRYSTIDVFGESVHGEFERTAIDFLAEIAESRELRVSFQTQISPSRIASALSQRSLLISVPWYDPGNWSVLEAVLSGCPAIIGEGAIQRLLDDELPTIPFVRFNAVDVKETVSRTVEQLANYDQVRHVLRDRINALEWPRSESPMSAIYQQTSKVDNDALQTLNEKYDEQLSASKRDRRRVLRQVIRATVGNVSTQSIGRKLRQYNLTWVVALAHWKRTRRLAESPGTSPDSLRQVIGQLEEATGGERFGRAWIWANLSRLEYATGRDLVGATYALRTMRLIGRDIEGQLPQVVATLGQHGFAQEAELAGLMFGPSSAAERHQKLLGWLDERVVRHQNNPSVEFARVDDRRGSINPRVTIIVSLYNAASKTPHFLDALLDQTLVQQGQVELILVDSGSPADEYSAIAGHRYFASFPTVYVRTANRETIQQAWNRGLTIARAPYVTMLGVDESITPKCLELLSGELDRRPDLDWIQANCVTYDTDAGGNYQREVMFSDRRGYHPELVRVDTNYLSWVGALYRRNLHERFGYYDPTFRGSGDKEFKNRLLPLINTDCYPHTLGIFWNYPDIRASQYPFAEIEDLRAWHLYRTSAGVEYGHRGSDPRQILAGAAHALKHRRCQLRTVSTDLEYACRLLEYAHSRCPAALAEIGLEQIGRTLDDFRTLDYPTWPNDASAFFNVAKIMSRMAALNRQLKNEFPNGPELKYFNDERCENINWCWSFLP